MKNATKHAEDLKASLKRLAKEYKVEPIQKVEPLKALVRASMCYDVSDAKADEAMREIDREFVDLNELRVATDLEIAELLGTRYPNIEKRVEAITTQLNAIFEKEHTLSLERLKTLGKKEARQFLRDLPNMTPFVEAYVMMFAFEGGAVPVDGQMLEYLKREGILEADASVEDAQKFLESHLKGDECYNFYVLVRQAAADEAESGGKKKKK